MDKLLQGKNYTVGNSNRTAIEAKILFAVCVIKKQALTGGKSLACEDKCSKKIGAKSAMLNFVFFVMLKNKIEQSAKIKLLLNSPTDRTFENRRSRYKEPSKNKAEAYRVYVEHLFLRSDAGDARIFSKEETGLYYYGARYLDPKYSRWLSGDPALNDYIPKAPINDEAKKHNENLPGMGGVFNTVNLHVYHYAGNNPVKYIDPDGRSETVHTDEGRQIHKKIYDMYSSAHQSEIVTGNTTSMSKVLSDLGKVDKGLGRTDLGLKLDIWNMTTNEIYEIKPDAAGAKLAKNQALLYISILKKYGEGNVHLGDSNAKGTSGFFNLNDKTDVFFHSPEQGVILYSKIPVPDSKPSNVRALAVTGLALYGIYKILRTAATAAVCPPLAVVSAVAP